jgi:hypothetical protein
MNNRTIPIELVRTPWQLDDAMRLSRLVEGVCPPFGCHVALTGGLLYKDGPRLIIGVWRIR